MPKSMRDGRRTALLSTLAQDLNVFRGSGHTNPQIQALLDAARASVEVRNVRPLRHWQKVVGGPQQAERLLLEYTRTGATHKVAETVYDLLRSY